MLKVSQSSLSFGEVAINDIPSYRQIKLQNTTASPIIVSLVTSTVMVKFQYANENYLRKLNESNEYNEIFDQVDLLESVEIASMESKEIIVFFRASQGSFSHVVAQAPPTVFTGTLQFITTGAQRSPPGTDSDHSETVTVPFTVNVFLSWLQVSRTELQVTMAPNKTQFIDFTVTNISCRPLSFVVRNQTIQAKGLDIALYEAERFEEPKLGHRLLLDSNASINLSVMIRTSANSSPCQYQKALQCDNLRDSRNTVLIYINVNITTESQGELLSVSDTVLNFGDIYRGSKSVTTIGFLNVGAREDVNVTLGLLHRRSCNGEVFLLKDDGHADEIAVPPLKGMLYVKVMYQPSLDSETSDISKIRFEVDFIASTCGGRKQRIVVRCNAVLYTSTIVVSQPNVNFGDCQVGQSKRHTFSIENKSLIPGTVVVQIRSKIISIDGVPSRQNCSGSRESKEEFTIGPLGTLSITLRITPQRVNPTYHKQLTIINTSSPSADRQIINIEANNMAPSEAKLHNELYTWECCIAGLESSTSTSPSTLRAITNVPLLVPYMARSKSEEPLVLSIKSTSPEIEVFYISDTVKTERLEAISTELRQYCAHGSSEDTNRFRDMSPKRVAVVIAELLSLLYETTITTTVELEPRKSVTVFVLIIMSRFVSEPVTKEDGLLISVNGIEVPRFVRLSYSLCGTSFDLAGQKTKDFGDVNIGTRKSTKLSIVNRCKSVLFMMITKSRSVTAGHIRIENSDHQAIYLSVRPFATREVELTFYPGIKGDFDEKINLVNVLDPQNYVVLALKATVTKADTFDVSPDSWNFSNVVIPQISEAAPTRVGARFAVTNTSKARRQIRLALDTSNLNLESTDGQGTGAITPSALLGLKGVEVKVQVDMDLNGSSSGSTRKIEEQIEKLEQKLKIYERKKKMDKLEVGVKRLEALRRTLMGEEIDLNAPDSSGVGPEHDFSESEDEAPKKQPAAADVLSILLRDGVSLPPMNAGESVTITFALTCTRIDDAIPQVQSNTLNLLLYEAKDKEVNRIVPIDVSFVRPEGEPDAPVNQSEENTSVSASAELVTPARIALGMRSLECSFMGYPLVGLRNCIIGEQVEVTLLVNATKSTSIVVLEPRRCCGTVSQSLDARFKFFPRNGLVCADEPLRIVLECTPQSIGPQKYLIPIKNLQDAVDIHYFVVDLNPTEEEERITTEPKELIYNDCITPCDPRCLEAKLLLIRSRFPYPHVLLVRSNKPSQIQFYEDAACRIPLNNPIQRTFLKETVRVYVKFIPSPMCTHERARAIHGGVLVEAITANGSGRYCTVGKSVVKVSARMGSGVVSVSATNLDLGSLSPFDTYAESQLKVYNPSDTFCVNLKVSPGSLNTTVDQENITLMPREELSIGVTLRLLNPGLVRDHVTITNLSCRQDPVSIAISALRRDEAVSCYHPTGENVTFPVAAVAKGEDGVFHLHKNAAVSVVIRNHTTKDIILVSQSDPVPLLFGHGGSRTEEGVTPNSRVRLEARQSQKVSWVLSGVPPLDEAQAGAILSHQIVNLHTVAHVNVAQIVDEVGVSYSLFHTKRPLPMPGQCVLLLPFAVQLAMSEGRAEPAIADLGTVSLLEENVADAVSNGSSHERPHCCPTGNRSHHPTRSSMRHRRQSSSVSICLRNVSPHVPLHLNVVCPPVIKFPFSRIVVPPGQSSEVEANVQLKLITEQGPFHYQAFFVNELNPENDMTVAITGQYYWKVFQLTCHGNIVEDSLKLTALQVDVGSSTPVILSEAKLTVTVADQHVQLYVTVQPNPQLQGLVQLQVVHYDATPIADSQLTFRETTPPTTAVGGQGGGATTNPLTADGSLFISTSAANLTVLGSQQLQPPPQSTTPCAGSSTPVDGSSGGARRKPQASVPAPSSLPPPVASLSKTLRLRCVLQSPDLSALAAAFYGLRKRQQSVALEGWTFDRLAELENRRRTASDVLNVWLGTVTFLNKLTDDEDFEIYGQLDPITTFTAPPKIVMHLSRLASVTRGGGVGGGANSNAQLAYTGELTLTNVCAAYTVDLSLLVLISSNVSMAIVVEIMSDTTTHPGGGGGGDEESHASIPSPLLPPPPLPQQRAATPVLTTFTNQQATAAATGSAGASTHPSLGCHHSANSNGSDGVVSGNLAAVAHRLSIPAKATTTLQVIIRSVNQHETTTGLQQSMLEQFIAMAIMDENIPSSVSVCRIGIAPFEGEEEDAPLYQPPRGLGSGSGPDGEGGAAGSGGDRTPVIQLLSSVEGGDSATTDRGASTGLPVAVESPLGPPLTSTGNAGTAGGTDGDTNAAGPTPNALATAATLSTPAQVISLRNCTPVAGCTGAYCSSFSMPRDEPPVCTISVRNNVPDRSVEYTVQVTSQGPLPWLLLPSGSGLLEGGEAKPLRLTMLAAGVGSFVGYIEIRNHRNLHEVVYLRLSAEVFLPSAGDGLFEVKAANGQRVATNTVHHMHMGHLYGADTKRACIAVEIANKGNVALEFPVSVVKPFRLELRTVADTMLPIAAYHGHPQAVSTSTRPEQLQLPSLSLSEPPFEGRLSVCHISGVALQTEQKYIVVDPKSRVRLAFVLSCSDLRAPEGYGVYGEADIVFKCKQARDANFTFRVDFQVFPPSFHTRREYEVPVMVALGSSKVTIYNSLAVPQLIIFRSHSPVVYVTPGTNSDEGDATAVAELIEAATRQGIWTNSSSKPVSGTASSYLPHLASFTELKVPPRSAAYFIVVLDHRRAAALLNFDQDDGERPALCEHGFVFNGSNPKERMWLEFRQFPEMATTATARRPLLDGVEGTLFRGDGASSVRGTLSPRATWPSGMRSRPPGDRGGRGVVVKPIKVGGQHINESFIMIFAQQFTATMATYADTLIAIFSYYQSRRDARGGGTARSTPTTDPHRRGGRGRRSSTDSDTSDAEEEIKPIQHHAPEAPSASLMEGTRTGRLLGGDEVGLGDGGDADAAIEGGRNATTALGTGGQLREATEGHSTRGGSSTLGTTTGSHRHALSASAWQSLRDLLLELTWLVDELIFYAILLRNSRLIEGYCAFLTAAVSNHPVMRVFKQARPALPQVQEYHIFAEYLSTLASLPFPTSASSGN